MYQHETDLVVQSSQGKAFDHIARGFFEHHGVWDPSVTSMTKISEGPVRLGFRGLEGRRFGPWAIRSEVEITEFEPDRRFAFATMSGPMHEHADWTIEGRHDGSVVHFHLRLVPAALGLRILEPLMRPMVARNVRRNAARMKAALDALAG